MRLARNVLIVIVVVVLLFVGGRWVYNRVVHRTPRAAPPTTSTAIQAIPAGDTRGAGIVAVVRYVDHGKKTIDVWALSLPRSTRFGPSSDGTSSVDGWEGYADLAQASIEAKVEADRLVVKARTLGEWCYGYAVSYAGVVLNPPPAAAPTSPPSAPPATSVPPPSVPLVTVKPIPAGEMRLAGTLVVIRLVNNSAKTIDVKVEHLAGDTKFGPNGMVSLDGWDGYQSLSHALIDACREANARLTEAQSPNSWCSGYRVTYMGGAVPSVCN